MHWSIPGDADNTTENVSFQINMYQKGAGTRPITWYVSKYLLHLKKPSKATVQMFIMSELTNDITLSTAYKFDLLKRGIWLCLLWLGEEKAVVIKYLQLRTIYEYTYKTMALIGPWKAK